MMTEYKKQWLQLVKEQEASGLSICEFAQRKRVNPKTFYARRHDFRRQGLLSTTKRQFIEVTTTTSVTSESRHNQIDIHIGNATLTLSDTINPVWLGKLIKAAQA